MNHAERLTVFQSQTENLNALGAAIEQVRRNVNASLKAGDALSASAATKTYALLFCAWAETNFSKLIHTPYGLQLDEVRQITLAHQREGIAAGWAMAVEFGLRCLDVEKHGDIAAKVAETLVRVIDNHLFDLDPIRNRLSLGQWSVVLSEEEDEVVDTDLTASMTDLDIVEVNIWFETHERFAGLVGALIGIPQTTVIRDWRLEAAHLENEVGTLQARTLDDYIARL